MGILQQQNFSEMARLGTTWFNAAGDNFDFAAGAAARSPFSAHGSTENTSSEYDTGWGGNRYAPPGLLGVFNVSEDAQKGGPVIAADANTQAAFGHAQYMGDADSPALARGKDHNGGTLLGQMSMILNNPQQRAGGNDVSAWSTEAAANKFKTTFSRWTTSNRSAYDNRSFSLSKGCTQAYASGGPMKLYSPSNRYGSSARVAAAVLSTVTMGGDLDWGDLTDETGDDKVGFDDYFIINDIATGVMDGTEANAPKLLPSGFGVKELLVTADYTGKGEAALGDA